MTNIDRESVPGFYAGDENVSIHYPEAHSGAHAASKFATSGDWAESEKTWWLNVRTWREIIEDGERVQVDHVTHKIPIHPRVPPCSGTRNEHVWNSNRRLVGGCAENPGVFGHDGGVRIESCCSKCGCGMTELTWDSDPSDGASGLYSIRYEVGKYELTSESALAE